ncbi:hypothetical protein DLH72_01035 [Candidatus Gracilibacteria bacterium]|nr:MAG: hypothetical protein DLH72_01035 [Candidatus Gracilibacteria bacterium]
MKKRIYKKLFKKISKVKGEPLLMIFITLDIKLIYNNKFMNKNIFYEYIFYEYVYCVTEELEIMKGLVVSFYEIDGEIQSCIINIMGTGKTTPRRFLKNDIAKNKIEAIKILLEKYENKKAQLEQKFLEQLKIIG